MNPTERRLRRQEADAEPGLLIEARHALGYTTQGLAKFLCYEHDRPLRRWETGGQDIPTLLWLLLFYMLREAGKRDLMDRVHAIISERRPG